MFGIMDLNTGSCWPSEDLTIHDIKNKYEPEEVTINDFIHKRPHTSWVIVPKDYINTWKSGHKCEHVECFKDGSVECHVPESDRDIHLDTPKNIKEYFCPDHAFEAGYCVCCGDFYGGIDNFDFGNGICDYCKEDLE